MIAESLARRYSSALFNLAIKENELEVINEQFQVLAETISANQKFKYFVSSPKIDIEEKKNVLRNVFDKHFSKTMMNFMFLVLDKKRQTLFEKMQESFLTMYNNSTKKAVITVRPATSLDKSTIDELSKVFSKKLDRTITVIEEVDPSLLGGLQVRIDNTIYDASVKGKLERMQKALIAN